MRDEQADPVARRSDWAENACTKKLTRCNAAIKRSLVGGA
jgi:hypothetical protein